MKRRSRPMAADAWLLQTRSEVRDGTHSPERNSVTLAEAVELWLERSRAEGLERSTLRTYGALVPHIVSDDGGIGRVKLAQLSTPMLEAGRGIPAVGAQRAD